MRSDIQFLRGIAVLAVVLYHYNLFPLVNGYLGVDIFFVISGYLITLHIMREQDQAAFSFARFYFRRARRLLPALYCTLAVTTVGSYYFLSERLWQDYTDQLHGALLFASNIVLPFQTGYFDDAAEFKPLLHTWSLSLEEQFYFVLPLLLYLISPKLRGVIFGALLVASLVGCQLLLDGTLSLPTGMTIERSDFAFYMLPTRAWELLAGSMVAWLSIKRPSLGIPGHMKMGLLVLLLGVIAVGVDPVLLRGDAILAVSATSLLLMGNIHWLPRWVVIRGIEKVGDWSYSIYLVHWPLISFAQIIYLGEVPLFLSMVLLLASLLLGYLQYRFVERRFRYTEISASFKLLTGLALSTIMLFGLSHSALYRLAQPPAVDIGDDWAEIREMNAGFGRLCTRGGFPSLLENCSNSPEPNLAVWGDSFAMHLVPGLLANPTTGEALVQITKSSCNPAMNLAEVLTDVGLAKDCLAFNATALQFMTTSTSIERVVISSPFGYFYQTAIKYIDSNGERDRDVSLAVDALVAAVKALQDAGKEVAIVSPPPSDGFNVGECLERKATGDDMLGRSTCNIDKSEYLQRRRAVIDNLGEVKDRTGVKILWLSDILCGKKECQSEYEGVPLYRDSIHLSIIGSERLLKDIRIF